MVAARQIQTPEIDTQEQPQAQQSYSEHLLTAILDSYKEQIGQYIESISLERQEEQEVIRVTLSNGESQSFSVDAVNVTQNALANILLQSQINTFLQQNYPDLAPESDISASRIAA